MPKIKCVVSYDGSKFYGFQIQNNQRSVQEEIQLVLFKIAKTKISITGAGRTDRGVHALHQVFNFESSLNMNENEWKNALNSLLPKDIYIKSCEFVDDSFHSRFSCKEKTYSYYLNMGEFNPIKNDYVYQYCKSLDVEKMNKAAQLFVGQHDFEHFCSNKKEEVDNFIKTIYSFEVCSDNNLVKFTVKGTGFLRYQVRMMVGTLIEIGANKKDESIITSRLDKKDAETISFNAPSCGLYLENIKY